MNSFQTYWLEVEGTGTSKLLLFLFGTYVHSTELIILSIHISSIYVRMYVHMYKYLPANIRHGCIIDSGNGHINIMKQVYLQL
jgi:hypothetical protein